jgi:hypothetical protein
VRGGRLRGKYSILYFNFHDKMAVDFDRENPELVEN